LIYKELLEKYQKDLTKTIGLSDNISIWRSIAGFSIPIIIYLIIKSDQQILLALLLLSVLVIFIILVRKHTIVQKEKDRINALVEINKNEIAFCESQVYPGKNGAEYNVDNSDYAYDLDFFGDLSLYHHLNRTFTYIGGQNLAEKLLECPVKESVLLDRQTSIEELSSKIAWRQTFSSSAFLVNDQKKDYQFLIQWAKQDSVVTKPWVRLLAYCLPVFLSISYFLFFVFDFAFGYTLGNVLFLMNLGFAGSYLKDIKSELDASDNLERILSHYSSLLKEIESEKFESAHLQALQKKLQTNQEKASSAVKSLSIIYNNLNSAANPIGAAIFNGLFLFHLHTFINLRVWKSKFSENIIVWLEVMGEIEALCSLANFRYNNPDYTFPNINYHNGIAFTNMGHPLIAKSKRICNDINFDETQFYILTGSNMSGKSTFLRTLGINLVLGGIGAPVCASHASIHPKKVLVSMRLSDSLSNAESYFYAEVKRLKYILDSVQSEDCFVLLDEILRGTNSEDKQFGTMEYIKRLISTTVLGIIATHDLEVCKLEEAYPDVLSNRNFSVEIVNNELAFDYKLRQGICNSKSASFMMKKMGVI